jgi:hypothetical protein
LLMSIFGSMPGEISWGTSHHNNNVTGRKITHAAHEFAAQEQFPDLGRLCRGTGAASSHMNGILFANTNIVMTRLSESPANSLY